MPKLVRVLLVEDSAIVRAAVASEFRSDPDFQVVGDVASLSEARGVELRNCSAFIRKWIKQERNTSQTGPEGPTESESKGE